MNFPEMSREGEAHAGRGTSAEQAAACRVSAAAADVAAREAWVGWIERGV